MKKIKSICVYCGSSPGNRPEFEAAARTLGKAIADHELELIYGGGTRGLMGFVADAVRTNGGTVTGIIPKFLLTREADDLLLKPRNTLDELHVVEDMHVRKRMMFERADAFVALPGGIGTLEEAIEMMTWAQIGQHQKTIVLANIANYWDPLTALLENMAGNGFLQSSYDGKPLLIESADEIIPAILAKQ